MNIAVVVPIYHANELHADFTQQTLESIQSQNHDLHVYVIVNHSIPHLYPKKEGFTNFKTTILDNPKGNHVGGSWNYGIKTALEAGAKYVLVINNDIVFHKDAIDNLVQFAEGHSEYLLWSAGEWPVLRTVRSVSSNDFKRDYDDHPHFSCFMVNQKTIDTVGWFDENLTMAYHEDGDYHYRIILSGNKASKTGAARFYHYGSRTIRVDEDVNAQNVRNYETNRAYIRKKWNTDFHDKAHEPPEAILKEKDIYKNPFNNKEYDYKHW